MVSLSAYVHKIDALPSGMLRAHRSATQSATPPRLSQFRQSAPVTSTCVRIPSSAVRGDGHTCVSSRHSVRRGGIIDIRAHFKVFSALRSDTPLAVRPILVSCIRLTPTREIWTAEYSVMGQLRDKPPPLINSFLSALLQLV